MRFVKRSGLVIASLLIAAMMTGARADIKFGLAAEPYPPFTVKEANGQWVGWEIDFMNALCLEIKENCSLEEVSWDGLLPGLVGKKYDAIMSSMTITKDREKVISFSDIYYGSPVVMIGTKTGDLDITPAHLSGKVIGVQSATTHATYAEKYYAPQGAVIKSYATQDEVNADLAAGRLDYNLADKVALGFFLKSDGGSCCEMKAVAPFDGDIFGVGVGFGVRQEDVALRDKLNRGIKTLAQRGFFEDITRKWQLTEQIDLPSRQ